jgi:hypothetical protein
MSDSRSAALSLDLISKTMNELPQEIGGMEPDDPKRVSFLKELSALTQLRRSLKSAGDHFIGERLDELAREMTTPKPGNPRRAQIVQEIMRLSDSLKHN